MMTLGSRAPLIPESLPADGITRLRVLDPSEPSSAPIPAPAADLDDFPRTCSLEELGRLAVDLGVTVPPPPLDEVQEKALRAAVCAAWDDPAAINRAVVDPPAPPGLKLGGLTLGTPPPAAMGGMGMKLG